MKFTFVFQTFRVLILSFLLTGFNFSLSFANDTHQCPLLHPTSFSFAIGKFIKDQRIQRKDYRIKTVVIDPGHGGHDPGCSGGSSREKHLALGIGKKLAQLMKAQFPNIKVIMTRNKDVFIPLYERAAIANRNNADLFISIHCNYMPGRSDTRGSETYVMGLHTAKHNLDVAKRENASILLEDDYEKNYDYDPNSPEGHIMLSMFQNAHLEHSILFAQKVEYRIKTDAKRRSRGVKQAGFVVLKETAMPSVLVEAGFLSNRREEAYLKTKAGQTTMAKAILQAFKEYKTTIEGKDFHTLAAAKKSPTPYTSSAAPKTVTPIKETKTTINPSLENKINSKPYYKTSSERTSTPSVVNKEPKIIPIESGGKVEIDKEVKLEYVAPKTAPSNIQFFVQLAASPRPLNTDLGHWRNTSYLIEVIQEDNLFKYQARNVGNFQQAFKARIQLQSQGFKDAFIVAYKEGKRIPIQQAKKELGLP